MIKKTIILLILILLTTNLFSIILKPSFETKEFSEDLYLLLLYNTMEQIEVENKTSQNYHYSFKDKNDLYEVRYILFSQVDKVDNIELQVGIWATTVLLNIAGIEDSIKSTAKLKKKDLKKDFNANYGITSFITDCKSDFNDKWKYLMVNFYYKKNIGIMCQILLFNDTETLKTKEFETGFHSFKFN